MSPEDGVMETWAEKLTMSEGLGMLDPIDDCI